MAFSISTPREVPEDGSSGAINTVIAIDRDKNSKHAVKWAVDNLLHENSCCTLIHVRTRSLHPHDIDSASKEGRPPTEEELLLFFLPYRGFCARKGIEAKELVLHDIDVPSALTDYIINNSINNIIVGSSNRNVITRKFKTADVPTSLLKSAPESCSVYIIFKGKVQNVRLASQSQNFGVVAAVTPKSDTATPTKQSQYDRSSRLLPVTSKSEHIRKQFSHGIWRSTGLDTVSFGRSSDVTQLIPQNYKFDRKANSTRVSTDRSLSGDSHKRSLSRTRGFSGRADFQLNDMLHENLEVSMTSEGSRSSFSTQTPKALEADMRRLKLELKQSTDTYSSVCGETIVVKESERQLQQCKVTEEGTLEEAMLAEETALNLADLEREDTRASRESAEMEERLAEMEIQKRKLAETRAKLEKEERTREINGLAHGNIQYRRYSVEEIEVATEFFKDSLKIGEGGYGPVYRAMLDDTAVAIKVLRPDLSHGLRQFHQEVEVLNKMRHPHMVLLLGACPEFGILVYEYLENGSLEDRLFCKDGTPPIPWKLRFKIAAEIATALLFLHKMKPEPLVHRDLKPANILLDRNYVSKISDVGLARLVPPSISDKTTEYRLTAAAGTFCYIDPEYQQTGMLGVKSDTYSLGVMLLQMITAKPPIGLSHQVEKAIERGTFTEVLDPAVTDWPVEEALCFAKLALKCCELRKRDRPDLGSVVLPELNRIKNLGMNSPATNGDRLVYSPVLIPCYSDQQMSSHMSQGGMSNNPNVEMEIQRRSMPRRWKALKSMPTMLNFRSSDGKSSHLPPTDKQVGKVSNKYVEGCWSFVSCSNTSPQLKKFYSFS
ncbi:Protein kinase domain [Quillaja saponaria]|uniref:RING-type E3 ubiquitin transferase n=1 Tax=Quillaja saponaria TaxID=32244 RepID=A0AAD7LRX9_QUISA|nr:Protein kinase domain [Quillaja saponaria]